MPIAEISAFALSHHQRCDRIVLFTSAGIEVKRKKGPRDRRSPSRSRERTPREGDREQSPLR